MTRKTKMIAGVLCGVLILILLMFFGLPHVFIAIGRSQYKRVGHLNSDLSELREKEGFSREDRKTGREFLKERERLRLWSSF